MMLNDCPGRYQLIFWMLIFFLTYENFFFGGGDLNILFSRNSVKTNKKYIVIKTNMNQN